MVRGTGKFGKAKRGGGRSFSRNMAYDTGIVESPSSHRKSDDEEEEEEEEEEEDAVGEEDEEEEGEEDNATGPSAPAQPELTRAERRELKKIQAAQKLAQKQGVDEDDEDADLINPNHVEKKLNISDLNSSRQLTRKEREAKEKQEAKDRYWKLHLSGETEEAKSDLARLQKIREEREAAQAKRKAEAEAKAAEIEAKKASTSGKRV